MNHLAVRFSSLMVLTLAAGLYQISRPCPTNLCAPTYYLVVRAANCAEQEVRVRGASNLPPGSIITLLVSDFDGDGWKEFSDFVDAKLEDKGFFSATIHPKKGLTFRRNLVVIAYFDPNNPLQPKEVLAIVGKKGEKLGELTNPQLEYVSGNYRNLSTIDRMAPCAPFD